MKHLSGRGLWAAGTVAVAVVAFLVGIDSGASEAATSGDVVYYADAPFGTIYCAAANSSVLSYVPGMSSTVVETTTDAKALTGPFCGGSDPRSSGGINARTALLNSAQQLCGASDWYTNASGSSVATARRHWYTQDASMPGSCHGTQSFYVLGATHVAVNLGWRDYLHTVGPQVGG